MKNPRKKNQRRNPKPGCCPTCGHELEPNDIYVDLMGNSVNTLGRTLGLTPRGAELMAILATKMPLWSDTEYLRQRLVGVTGAETSAQLIQVHICVLRKALREAAMPLEIQNSYGKGYRLAFVENDLVEKKPAGLPLFEQGRNS